MVWAQGDLGHDVTLPIHLQQTRPIAGFGQQNVPVLELLDGVDLGLSPLEFEYLLATGRHLDNAPARIRLALVEGSNTLPPGSNQPSREAWGYRQVIVPSPRECRSDRRSPGNREWFRSAGRRPGWLETNQ